MSKPSKQDELRRGAPENGAARCRQCNNWRPAEHFTANPSHQQTSNHVRRTPLARWRAKVDFDGPGGCWNWLGAKGPRGYGTFWLAGAYTPAYRAAWTLLVGAIPAGLELDHLCRNPSCVNPEHLEPVTHAENVRRSSATDALRARNQSKTHCPQGHPYDGSNVSFKRNGHRRCKACDRAYYHRRRAEGEKHAASQVGKAP